MGFWSNLWSGIKRVGRGIGNVVSAPFRAIGNVVSSGAKRLIGGLASAGERGGVTEVIKEIGGGIKDVAGKVGSIPIIKDTPLGRIAQGITKVDALTGAILDKDIGKAVSVGKDIVGDVKGLGGGVKPAVMPNNRLAGNTR